MNHNRESLITIWLIIILALVLMSFIATADAAPLTVTSVGKGGSVAVEGGDLYVKNGTGRRNYSGKVLLHANPWRGWRLKSWMGACKGRSDICRLDMRRARTVKATWEKLPKVKERLSVYASDGQLLGDLTGTDNGSWEIGVLTSTGYIANIYREDGHLAVSETSAPIYYDDLNCTGAAYTDIGYPRGTVSRDYESGKRYWVEPDAEKQEVQLYSRLQYDECVANFDGFTWNAYPAKVEGRDDWSETGLPESWPWEPVTIR